MYKIITYRFHHWMLPFLLSASLSAPEQQFCCRLPSLIAWFWETAFSSSNQPPPLKTLWLILAPSPATKDKIVELSASRVGVQQTNYTHWSASEHKSGLMYLVCFKQGNLLKTAKTGGASSRTHLRLSLYVVFISFRKRFLFGVSLNSATFLS